MQKLITFLWQKMAPIMFENLKLLVFNNWALVFTSMALDSGLADGSQH